MPGKGKVSYVEFTSNRRHKGRKLFCDWGYDVFSECIVACNNGLRAPVSRWGSCGGS